MVKMTILPKAITDSVQFQSNSPPHSSQKWGEKTTLKCIWNKKKKEETKKCIWNHKKSWIAKTIWSKKNNPGGIAISDLKIYYKAIGKQNQAKKSWYQHK